MLVRTDQSPAKNETWIQPTSGNKTCVKETRRGKKIYIYIYNGNKI